MVILSKYSLSSGMYDHTKPLHVLLIPKQQADMLDAIIPSSHAAC